MDSQRFDGLTRQLTTAGTRRQVLGGLLVGALGGSIAAPIAHEAAAGGNCRKGQHQCHGKCCPSRGPVCCNNGCCKKGYKCCGNTCRRK